MKLRHTFCVFLVIVFSFSAVEMRADDNPIKQAIGAFTSIIREISGWSRNHQTEIDRDLLLPAVENLRDSVTTLSSEKQRFYKHVSSAVKNADNEKLSKKELLQMKRTIVGMKGQLQVILSDLEEVQKHSRCTFNLKNAGGNPLTDADLRLLATQGLEKGDILDRMNDVVTILNLDSSDKKKRLKELSDRAKESAELMGTLAKQLNEFYKELSLSKP